MKLFDDLNYLDSEMVGRRGVGGNSVVQLNIGSCTFVALATQHYNFISVIKTTLS